MTYIDCSAISLEDFNVTLEDPGALSPEDYEEAVRHRIFETLDSPLSSFDITFEGVSLCSVKFSETTLRVLKYINCVGCDEGTLAESLGRCRDFRQASELLTVGALRDAIIEGLLDVVKHIIAKYPGYRSERSHRDLIFIAAGENHPEVMKYLLDIEVDNSPNAHGWTPLYMASIEGRYEVVKLLLESGAGSTSNIDGNTPMHAAAGEGHYEVVKLLLESGAGHFSIGEHMTPFAMAYVNGHTEVMELLSTHTVGPFVGPNG